MATPDDEPAPLRSAPDLDRRWELVLALQPEMLRVARRRTGSREDAEDVVMTAMVRTVEHADLDESRVAAFFCTAVKRLAVDVHRSQARQVAVGVRAAARELPAAPADEAVCDAAEARWLASALETCPPREREVLLARMAGLSTSEASARLGLTRKATENALARVRARARGLLAATLAGIGVLVGAARRTARPAWTAVPVAAVAAVALTAIPHGAVAPSSTSPTVVVQAADTAPPPPVPEATPTGAPPTTPSTEPDAPQAAAPSASPDQPPQVVPPSPERTVLVPTVDVPGQGPAGGVYIEPRHQDESLAESVQRCIRGTNAVLVDPTADPCA